MAIYDSDGTTSYEIGSVFDNDGTANNQIAKGYDHDGTIESLVFQAGTPWSYSGSFDWRRNFGGGGSFTVSRETSVYTTDSPGTVRVTYSSPSISDSGFDYFAIRSTKAEIVVNGATSSISNGGTVQVPQGASVKFVYTVGGACSIPVGGGAVMTGSSSWSMTFTP